MIFAMVLGASLGAAFASFACLAATRLPRGESVVRPRSSCASCRVPIRFFDNVPIVSWLALRGRCRSCAGGIAPELLYLEIFGALVGCILARTLLTV